MQRRRSDDPGEAMIVELPLPQYADSLRVERIDVSLLVGEIGGECPRYRRAENADADRGAHAGLGGKAPVRAAGRGIEREHAARHARYEDPVADDRRLAVGHDSRIAECPFHLEPGDFGGGEARRLLEAGIVEIVPPAVPLRRRELDRVCARHAAIWLLGLACRARYLAGQKQNDGADLLGTEPV